MMAAFRRKLVVAAFGVGACTEYGPSLLIGGGGGAPSFGGGSESGGRAHAGSSTTGGAPGDVGGRLGSGGSSAASGSKAGGAGGNGGRSGAGGGSPEGGEGGESGDSNGGEAGMGAAGAAGEAPRAGTGGMGGGETCTGCARLSVPLTVPGDRSHFVIALAGGPDFTGATVHYRAFLHAGTTGQFIGYLQDTSGFSYQAIGSAALGSFSGWQDLAWVVTPTVSGFDVTDIQLLGIEILGETGALNPTVVYVDSITVPSVGLEFTFDDATTVMEGPQTEHLSDQKLWLNSDSEAGSALTWLGE